MTVNYNSIISSGHSGTFITLLVKWRGSLYKLVWVDLLIYVCIYYVMNFVYRFTLTTKQQEKFEDIVMFCYAMKNNIPVSFLLGFFVSGVIARWWKMFYNIPRLQRLAFVAQSFMIGRDSESARRTRYTFMRYIVLSWILLMRKISAQIKNRYKSTENDDEEEQNEVDQGLVRRIMENINKDPHIRLTFRKLVTEDEIQLLEKYAVIKSRRKGIKGASKEEEQMPSYWIPLQWAARWAQKAYLNGYISDPRTMVAIVEEIDELRRQMQTLKNYSNLLIPLVYTQVVIISVYSFFLCQLFASQFVDPKKQLVGHEVDFYVPVFPIFQFLYLMGWLKVALCVINPFGDDDEDFDTSDMLDEALDITYRSVGAEPDMFPPMLHPTIANYKIGPTAKDDKFEEFQLSEREDSELCSPMTRLEKFNFEEEPKQSILKRTKSFLCPVCHCKKSTETQESNPAC